MSLLINLQKSLFYSQKDKVLAFDSYHLILVKFEEKLSKYKSSVWSKKNLEQDFKCTALQQEKVKKPKKSYKSQTGFKGEAQHWAVVADHHLEILDIASYPS